MYYDKDQLFMLTQYPTKHTNRQSRHTWSAYLASALVVLLAVLLTACSAGTANTASNTPTPPPTATINPTLQKQGDMELQTYQQWIALMQQYNGNTSSYQQQYTADQQALQSARNETAYKAALAKLQAQVDAIKIPAMKTQANALLQQLKQGAATFGHSHTYTDTYNNTTYPLGYEYGTNGIAGWAAQELSQAQTLSDFQQTIEDLNMYLTNFQAMLTNITDKTPASQVHQTDIQLLQHYGYMNNKVVVVSLEEQAARIYQNGKLVNAFLVTTGRPDKPTPPGTWWIEVKKSPDVFKASVPQSSPYWYPDTPINYAMLYHSNGYYLHDSWWRNDYGFGTQFPHLDSSGDSFSSQGSHGCVNISKANAAWLYSFVTQISTKVMIY
jgi:lipoprotein-anchoring transpeptidase ErfK/SrfK